MSSNRISNSIRARLLIIVEQELKKKEKETKIFLSFYTKVKIIFKLNTKKHFPQANLIQIPILLKNVSTH